MKIYETKDAHLIARLNKPVHDLHVTRAPEVFKPYDETAMTAFFEEIVQIENHLFYVVENEVGHSAGYIWVELKQSKETPFKYASSTLFVHQLSVNENERGKGYGRALLKHAEHIAKSHQISSIQLDYWEFNVEANNFYKKQGFEPTRQHVIKHLS
jgi:diamine N-acetyltransferase